MLGGASVVVPEIKIDKINGIRKWGAADAAIGAQAVQQNLYRIDFVICSLHHLLRLRVHAIYDRSRVALIADLLHLRLRLRVVRTLRGDRISEEIGQTLGGIMRHAQSIDAA